jgi:glycosyltransferase involved in cell wall biosynthesis
MGKKVAYIINHLSFFHSHLMPHALKARKAGYDIKVFCGDPVSYHSEKFAKKQLLKEKIKYVYCNFSSVSLNPVKDFLAFFKIYRELRIFNPDIVHITTLKAQIFGGIISRIIKIDAIIFFISGMGYLFSNRLNVLEKIYKKVFYIIQKIVFKHKKIKIIVENKYDYKYFLNSFSLDKNKIIVENKYDYKYFLNFFSLSKDKIIIIKGSGVDLLKFTRVNHLQNKIILLPARVILEKGIIEFVKAANLLKKYDYKFFVAGSLDYNKPSSFGKLYLNKLNLNKSVKFIGYQKNIFNVLKKTSIVCLPSYREGLPKSLCEAASCGIPIVTTNTVGCTEVVKQNFNGELCKIQDYVSLQKKLEKLILNPKIRSMYGKNSRVYAKKNFDINLISNQIINIYNKF